MLPFFSPSLISLILTLQMRNSLPSCDGKKKKKAEVEMEGELEAIFWGRDEDFYLIPGTVVTRLNLASGNYNCSDY